MTREEFAAMLGTFQLQVELENYDGTVYVTVTLRDPTIERGTWESETYILKDCASCALSSS